MQRIDDQSEEDVRLAKNILVWVCHAVNPLTMDEMRHALAMSDLEGEKQIDDEDLPDSEILVSVCAGYVTMGLILPSRPRWPMSLKANIEHALYETRNFFKV